MVIISRISGALTTRRLLLFCAVMLVVNWLSMPGEAPESYDPSSELGEIQSALGDIHSTIGDLESAVREMESAVENIQYSVDGLQR